MIFNYFKISRKFRTKNIFYLNNEGSAVRDFISYSQAASIYTRLILLDQE